jgi:translation initiation factor IF-2
MLVVEDATAAREVAQRRERLDREAKSRRSTRGVTLEDFMAQSDDRRRPRAAHPHQGGQGGPAKHSPTRSVQLGTTEVKVEVVHRGVRRDHRERHPARRASGRSSSGFHVRPDNNARAAAERENVDIKLYRIIYEAVADVRAAPRGMLRPEEREVVLGEARCSRRSRFRRSA